MNGQDYTYRDIDSLDRIFEEAFEDYAFAGGSVAVGTSGKVIFQKSFGYHTYAGNIKRKSSDIHDIASLTKVCATTPSIMKLYDEGKLCLTDKVSDILPEVKGPTDFHSKLKSQITVAQLLYHSSGFPPDNDIYKMRDSSLEEKWASVYRTPLAYYPGVKFMYSDINMLLLGKIVERVSGQPLDKYTVEKIYKPLGMNETFFKPDQRYCDRIIPTEFSIYNNAPYKGVVDDENARGLGGVAGHAGLFSTCDDLVKYASMITGLGTSDGREFMKESTVRLFAERDKSIHNSNRAMGWHVAYNPYYVIPSKERCEDSFILDKSGLYENLIQPSAGVYVDPDAMGHTGFTGSSFWISLKHGIYVLFLTNRVFPSRNYTPIDLFNYWRQRVNSAVWKNLGFTEKNELFEMKRPSFYHKEN